MRAYWISLALAPFAFLLFMKLIDRAPPLDPSLLRSTFRALASEATQPPDFSSAPEDDFKDHVDYIPVNERNIASGWYQVQIPLREAPRELWGIFLPSTFANFSVYVNGVP